MTTEGPGATTRPAWTIELCHGYFAKLAAQYGWLTNGSYDYSRIAAELGISESQARRILNAEQRPSTNFIGGLHVATDDDFRYRKAFRPVLATDPIGKE